MESSDRESHLDQVLVGGREHVPIVIADYDPAWRQRFEAERDRIRDALGDAAGRIEHIGSTSVRGLAAKPIIDILVTVADPDDESVLVPRLADCGYELRVREPGHRMFRSPGRDVHVHVWSEPNPEVERYLRFRDRLRRSAEDCSAYEQLKRALARRDWEDMNDYAEAKTELIEAILRKPAP